MRSLYTSVRYMPALILALAGLPASSGAAATDIDINVFVDRLEPYGRWVETGRYGLGWIPNNIPADWRPYTDGRWVWTDEYGWTWVSDYEWGWAPFHYGRWYRDSRYGWTWIPGTEWAPAWVAWRRGKDHIGWAPLPPQVRWSGGSPLRYDTLDLDDLIEGGAWVFLERRHFVTPNVRRYTLPAPRAVRLIPVTRNVTYYAPFETRIVNRSIPLDLIAGVVGGAAVPRLRVESVDSFDVWKGRRMDGRRLYVYRPDGSRKAKSAGGASKTQVKVKERPGKLDVKLKDKGRPEWQGERGRERKPARADASRGKGGADVKHGGRNKGKGQGRGGGKGGGKGR